AINKMDMVNWDEKKYETVKTDVSGLLKLVGFKPDEIPFIPCSAYLGENVVNKSSKIPWWKGNTVLGTMDEKIKVPEKPTSLPLRTPIQDVYTITGIGTVPVGRVETGIIKVGDKIIFEPSHASGECKSIEMHHEQHPKAEPGDNIGFNVRGVGKTDIRRG